MERGKKKREISRRKEGRGDGWGDRKGCIVKKENHKEIRPIFRQDKRKDEEIRECGQIRERGRRPGI